MFHIDKYKFNGSLPADNVVLKKSAGLLGNSSCLYSGNCFHCELELIFLEHELTYLPSGFCNFVKRVYLLDQL